MSLTSKQIDGLRAYAKDRKGELAKMLNDAADTIELLSAKLHTSQMERSSAYYHGGWIPVTERLPKIAIPVLLSEPSEIMIAEYYGNGLPEGLWKVDGIHHWLADNDGCAWMPLPEPYREEGE